MKDDIKEIITRMASYTIHYDCCSEGDAEEDIDKILDYITNLQEENKRLKEWKKDLLNENIELENIRKEAIEYIEEDIKGNYFKRYEDEVYKMCDYLLNILKGKDNE